MSTHATYGCICTRDLLPSVANIQGRERMLMSGLVIEREVLIEAPAEVVWRTITEPDQITQWFASRVELVVEPGAHGYMEFGDQGGRSEEHTSELQSQFHLVCRLLLEKKKQPGKRDGLGMDVVV